MSDHFLAVFFVFDLCPLVRGDRSVFSTGNEEVDGEYYR